MGDIGSPIAGPGLTVADFDFDLPPELIAQAPPAERGTSRLLVLDRATGARQHATIGDLPRFLRPGDLLVLNDTRVFPARLLGRRDPSGGAVECLLLRPVEEAGSDAGEPAAPGRPRVQVWEALVHPGQKLKPGTRIVFEDPATGSASLRGDILARQFHGRRLVRLESADRRDIMDAVHAIGHMPLPPYIHRPDTALDRDRYQTVYARTTGSIAAPTAGLHFTPALLDRLDAVGVERTAITLHVGYGTFKPVRVERVEDHEVDPEPYTIGPEAAAAIAAARAEGRRVVAVGTTTVRALENAARAGAAAARGPIAAGPGLATLFLHPGIEFRVVDALLTNFHLPRSSLLMLVSAFAGRERILDAYREAIAERYRFYSYGDAMLIG